MALYCIGGLRVGMAPKYGELGLRAAPFLCENRACSDFGIDLTDAEIEQRARLCGFTLPLAEYQLSCERFCAAVLPYRAFVLHASAVLLDGKVYLFSAPSGVGKSTHTEKWRRLYGGRIINDDKPLIRMSGKKALACGSPWCGSGLERLNEQGEVKALFFIRRRASNKAFALDSGEALYLLLESMFRPADRRGMDCLSESPDAFMSGVRIFGLDCNADDDAAKVAFRAAEAADFSDVEGKE